jgi:hypothetical protein
MRRTHHPKTRSTIRIDATVLAALRYWQREGLLSSGHEQDIATDGGCFESLSSDEIDALCEAINVGEVVLATRRSVRTSGAST